MDSYLKREEYFNSLFRKLQIFFSDPTSKLDTRELFKFSCSAGPETPQRTSH